MCRTSSLSAKNSFNWGLFVVYRPWHVPTATYLNFVAGHATCLPIKMATKVVSTSCSLVHRSDIADTFRLDVVPCISQGHMGAV